MSKDTPLKVEVVDDELVIRIGVDTLAHAIANGDDFYEFDPDEQKFFRNFAITDPSRFAQDVANMLEGEDGAGASPISKLLDDAAQWAVDDGSTGVEHEQRIPQGKKSPLETFE